MESPRFTRDIIYTGLAQVGPAAPRLLRAGPLSALLDGMDLRYIRLGGREILRRVYVAVRDPNWNTIPATYSDVQMEIGADHFAISFEARHQAGEVNFAWHGVLRGDADGTISYTMDGKARRAFRKNRIGFCVLHPMECAGVACTVAHVDGTLEHGAFPIAISPHQPFLDFVTITHEVVPGVQVETRLDGDVFEMEDQRNWTDASFKTYSTPLRRPYPVELAQDARVAQSFTLRLHGDRPTTWGRDEGDGVVEITLDPSTVYPLPQLGLGLASHGRPLSERETAHLRALRPAHLRADLDLSAPGYEATVQQAVEQGRALGAPLEVALFVSDAAERELATLLQMLRRHQPRIARWLVFHREQPVTGEPLVELAHRVLGPYQPGAPVGGGSNAYFTQLNRNRPRPGSMVVVSYSINPQVHAFDNSSLTETLPAQAETLRSARRFCGDGALVVSPVTLKPRFNPDATAPEQPLAPGQLPAPVDPRQMSLFGAGWTAGSIKYLAEGGAASVTYYETTGWRGVMEAASGPPEPMAFPSAPGMLFPLYHVLADAGELSGGSVLRCRSSDPLAVETVALREIQRLRLLLANMTAAPREVMARLPGVSAARLRLLDEQSFERAALDGTAFRAEPGEARVLVDGVLRLTLPPYAVARLDAEPDMSGQPAGA